MASIYDTEWSVADEKPTPDDEQHRALRPLNLTVAGCTCRRCCNLRDISIVGLSPIEGYGRPAKDERVARAVDRINARPRLVGQPGAEDGERPASMPSMIDEGAN